MTIQITRKTLLISAGAFVMFAGYMLGTQRNLGTPLESQPVVLAAPRQEDAAYKASAGTVPKSYGRLVAAIADRIGTGLVFEDKDGVIRFVSITGMKEGQLARYGQAPTHGGIPKSYGRLAAAVVNERGTGLIFEDVAGTIRFVTIAGVKEGELKRQ